MQLRCPLGVVCRQPQMRPLRRTVSNFYTNRCIVFLGLRFGSSPASGRPSHTPTPPSARNAGMAPHEAAAISAPRPSASVWMPRPPAPPQTYWGNFGRGCLTVSCLREHGCSLLRSASSYRKAQATCSDCLGAERRTPRAGWTLHGPSAGLRFSRDGLRRRRVRVYRAAGAGRVSERARGEPVTGQVATNPTVASCLWNRGVTKSSDSLFGVPPGRRRLQQ